MSTAENNKTVVGGVELTNVNYDGECTSEEAQKILDCYISGLESIKDFLLKQLRRVAIYSIEKRQKKRLTPTVKLSIVNVGTCVEVKYSLDALISEYHFYIGAYDIMRIVGETGIDPIDACRRLATHEMLHITLGHLSKSFQRDIHRNIMKENFYQAQNVLDFSCLLTRDQMDDLKRAHPKPNGTVLNIAEDLYINETIGVDMCGITPKIYGLPSGLDELGYYSIIFQILNAEEPGTVPGFNSMGLHTHVSDYYHNIAEDIKDLYASATLQRNEFDVTIVIDSNEFQGSADGKMQDYDATTCFEEHERFKEGKMFGKGQGYRHGDVSRLSKAKTGIWKECNDILNELSKAHQLQKLSLVGKTESWTHFNNRRKQGVGVGSMCIPGKMETKGAIERKITMNNVLFVDVSGSMYDELDAIFAFCEVAIKKLNLTVVFYDTQIVAIYDRNNLDEMEPFVAGGTCAYKAVKEYQENHKNISNLYIITDAEDATLPAVVNEWNTTIWKVLNHHIYKIKG